MTAKGLLATLFSRYHRRILALTFLRPEQSFHVREIARQMKIPAGSVHRELKRLAEAGLLLREPSGNQVRYRANRESPIFLELASIFRKTDGLADVIRDALEPLGKKVELALVFGSMAHGETKAGSDVDILVVGSATLREAVGALSPLQEGLGREINPVVVSHEKFVQGLKSKDRLFSRIVNEPKIFVKGTARDFAKLGQDSAA
jgi:predicted nucleotidyltransferase